jgi:signal transduction histidine kinase
MSITQQDGHIALQVLSRGASIPQAEHNLIFDRFYRGAEARRLTHGTGLGLYVARKIAVAHGGSLNLDGNRPDNDGVAFRLSLPVPQSEREDVAAAG